MSYRAGNARESKKQRTPRLIPKNLPAQWTGKNAIEHLGLSVGEAEIPRQTYVRVRSNRLLIIDLMMLDLPTKMDQSPQPHILVSFEQTIDNKWKVTRPGDKRPVYMPHFPTTHLLLAMLQQEVRTNEVNMYLQRLDQALTIDEETMGLIDTFLRLRGLPDRFFAGFLAKLNNILSAERLRRWFY